MGERIKVSFDFPKFFSTIIRKVGKEFKPIFRDLTRELEKLHIELAKAINRNVGDLDWIAVSFQNSWANRGGSDATAAYMKINQDVVLLKGLIDTGTPSSIAFTLPTGYRPAERLKGVVSAGNNAYARIDIDTDGTVTIKSGGSTWTSLNGISFRADA